MPKKMKKIRGVQDRSKKTGKFLPVDGMMSAVTIATRFGDKRYREYKLLQMKRERLIEDAGGPANMIGMQWDLLDRLSSVWRIIIIGEAWAGDCIAWVDENGNMPGAIERLLSAHRLADMLTKQFYATIKPEEKDPYVEALKVMEGKSERSKSKGRVQDQKPHKKQDVPEGLPH